MPHFGMLPLGFVVADGAPEAQLAHILGQVVGEPVCPMRAFSWAAVGRMGKVP